MPTSRWSGHQKNWILRRVLRVGWNRWERTDWFRQIQDVLLGGGIDDIHHTAITTGKVGARTVTAGGHHEAEARGGADRNVVRRTLDGRVGKAWHRHGSRGRVAHGVDLGHLRE